MKPILKKIGDVLFKSYLILVLAWVFFAFSFQVFFVYLELSGQEELAKHYSDEITIRIDGNFKNNPKNIWYEGDK